MSAREKQVIKCHHITVMIGLLTLLKKEVATLRNIYEEEKDDRQVQVQMDVYHDLSTNLEYYNRIFSEENAILAQIYLDDYNNMRKGGPSNE